jgi:hypothetical protein
MLEKLQHLSNPLALFKPCDELTIFSADISDKSLSAWGPSSKQPATELDKYVIKVKQSVT